MLVAGELVVPFRVVTSVGRQLRETDHATSLGHEWAELIHIGTRSTSGVERVDEMVVGACHDAELRVVVINNGFPRVFHPIAATDEVPAGRSALQAGRVDRRPFHPPLAAQVQTHRRAEEFSHRRREQQPPRRFLKRGEVGNLLQSQLRDERRIVGQVDRQAPIVGLQKLLQHQAGEELMLRELLGTIPMGVLRQCPLCRCQRRQNDCPR